MNILVIGSGGREHALVWKLSKSRHVKKIYCAPGNGGMASLSECVDISPENIPGLLDFAKKKRVDLTVVGPELPLSLGIVDEFEKNGMKIFGPRKSAAVLEFSKCFTKEFCARHGIPTAGYSTHIDSASARKAIKKAEKYPLVIKADGLASGKGVVIAGDRNEAIIAVDEMLVRGKFGEAGRRVIIEEFLEGEEATYMAATDGRDFTPLQSAQDHKRVYDNDMGPNTGGMGAYSPASLVSQKVEEKILDKIIRPIINGMKKEGRPYKGILYAGLMINKGDPKLVEVNSRFGDPEAQVILFRLKSDLVDLMEAVIDEKISGFKADFFPEPAVCVVMSSKGYPGSYEKGKVINGLTEAEAEKGVVVFHAGTRFHGGNCVTNGGRVLGVTAKKKDLKSAIDAVYKTVEKISWEGAHYRSDIGRKGLGFA